MLLKFHRFASRGGGEESVILPIPDELAEDVSQGDFDIECLSDDGHTVISYWKTAAKSEVHFFESEG